MNVQMPKNLESRELSLPQENALQALLTSTSYEAAAAAAGIAPKTLWRFLKEPRFVDAYQQARREAVSQSVAQLQRLTADAVLALGEVARDASATSSARVAAAKAIFDVSLRALEVEDVNSRLAALELVTGVGES